MIALDASALLAFLFRETGHEQVREALGDACISTVNLSETLGRLARDGRDPEPLATGISKSGIEIVDFTEPQALTCARLLPQTRELGLSLGGRACVALAIERGIPAMTVDRVWLKLHSQVDVRVIR